MSQESTKNFVIFTDLDGTLLDYSTYSFDAALPALKVLKEKNIPLVICSSKTKTEIEYYRKKLDNYHPFISENGGGIFIPKNYFKFKIQNSKFKIEEEKNYIIIRLGAQYYDLRMTIEALRREGFDIKGFGDMSIKEVAETAGMSIDEAKMAKERDFDEPFIFEGDDAETQRLFDAIRSKGFNYTQGRFFHILGDSDKGKSVEILKEMYKKEFGEITAIAIGDSPNDIPMLEKVNYPVIVKKHDGNYDSRMNMPNLIKADGIGPEGWNKAVIKLINDF
ncbi:MAG: HAD-IIB family hydrolase [Nitrospirota bacterium]